MERRPHQPSTTLTEKTKITLGAAAAIGIFLGTLLVWAIRAESALNSKVDKLSYIEDITEIKADLKVIRSALKKEDR